ncbi:hypothetical protein [Neptunomonas japonica]|uniref:hypothetical protein n=1 Tax=Neptunomonas japonica TaxID=417574 RepID=UPI00042892F6|nr:hypothetical protein [Neptunomonas japonica]
MSSKDNIINSRELDDSSLRLWRWRSTLERADKLEFSVLAGVETLLAILIYVWLALEGITFHLIAAACVTPFILLRTSATTKNFNKLIDIHFKRLSPYFLEKTTHSLVYSLMVFLVFCATFPIYIIFTRIKIVIKELFSNPLDMIQSIPQNWWKLVGCIDVFYPPETMPGTLVSKAMETNPLAFFVIAPYQSIITISKYIYYGSDFRTHRASSIFAWLFGGFIIVVTCVGLLLPAIVYRISMKGASIIYLPLLWLVHIGTGGDVAKRLQVQSKYVFYKIQRIIAILAIIVVFTKIVMFPFWIELTSFMGELSRVPFVDVFIAPLMLPKWQIASAFNGLIVWLLFLVGEFLSPYIDYAKGRGSTAVKGIYRVSWLLSGCLTLYTLAILIYNAFILDFNLPPIGEEWFPW